MPRKRGEPKYGEIVVCNVSKINPNSAYCELKEYPGKEGLIQIGEVASGWVRDIRHFLKEGKEIVAGVVKTNPLELSIKRVSKKSEMDKTKEWNLEKRAERMLENIAKERGVTLDQAYEEVGYELQETFGTLYAAFKESIQRPERIKKSAGDWFDSIVEVARKEIGEKTYEFRAEIFIRTLDPNGIAIVKDVLKKLEKEGLNVKYIAAPKYLVTMDTKDPKKAEKQMQEKLTAIASQEKNVEMDFKIL